MSWPVSPGNYMSKASVSLTYNALSMLVWAKRTATCEFSFPMVWVPDNPPSYAGIFNGSGEGMNARAKDDSDTLAETPQHTYNINEWNCWLYCREAGNTGALRLFKDGSEVITNDDLSTWLTNQIGTIIFSHATGSFTGKLAHMAIWNSDLNAVTNAVANLAAGDNPETVDAGNLLEYWFDSKTGRISGIVLDTTGTVTWDSGDNPTVDAPVASAVQSLMQISG